MATDARKRHKHTLERQTKREQKRSGRGGSPYRKLVHGGEVVACYINRDWREDGMISLHVLRRRADGGHTMGAFLVDPWCIGLKDACGRLNVSPSEFRDDVIGPMSQHFELERVNVTVARRLVAGGIRFARQNGFRLPRNWDRWTPLLGDTGDWRTADLSDFGIEGGRLRFVGDPEDLRQRLVDCTLEQFLEREDVEFLVGSSLAPPGPDLKKFMEASIGELTGRALQQARQWCFANNLTPSPRLPEIVEKTLRAAGLIATDPDEGDDNDQVEEAAREFERLLGPQAGQEALDYRRALDQMQGFLSQFPTPDAFIEAMDRAD